MTESKLPVRDAATTTSPAPLVAGDVPEQDGSEDPQVGLESIRDTAVSPEKDQAQSKGIAPGAVPPSPSTMEHLNSRSGLRGAADSGKREGSGAEEIKAGTVGVGEGATVNHLPDGGPR